MAKNHKIYWKSIILAILVLGIIAYIDLSGTLLIGYDNYTKGFFDNSYWLHFRNMVFLLMLIVPTIYYLFTKDKSETFAIFISSIIGFYFGISDLFYFWLDGKMVPSVLPWLTNHPIIGKVATLTNGEVTSTTIYISVILGLFIIVMFSKIMERLN